VAAVAALPLAACEGMKKKDRVSRLDQSVNAYVGAIRWGHFQTAAAFAVPRAGTARPLDPDTLTGLKVTGFSVRIGSVDEAGIEAQVSIGFTYYHEDRGTIREVEQSATWYFDPGRSGWLMDGPLPQFRR
jgi:hypothetical protein